MQQGNPSSSFSAGPGGESQSGQPQASIGQLRLGLGSVSALAGRFGHAAQLKSVPARHPSVDSARRDAVPRRDSCL